MLRLLLPLSIGILIRLATPPAYQYFLFIPLLVLIALSLLLPELARLRRPRASEARRRVSVPMRRLHLLPPLLALTVGFLRTDLALRHTSPDPLVGQILASSAGEDTSSTNTSSTNTSFVGEAYSIGAATVDAVVRLTSEPEPRERSVRVRADLLRLHSDALRIDTVFSARGARLLLYLPVDSASLRLGCGDKLAARLTLYPLRPSGNPDSFDYSARLRREGVVATAYASPWHLLSAATPQPQSDLVERLRVATAACIDAVFATPERRALMQAMLLGESDALPDTLRDTMARSGLAHILAVSGLHTGILFLLLMWLLWPVRYLRGTRPAAVLAILALWGYVALTGCSASVVRAATMLTLAMAGRILLRDRHLLGALGATACLMLLFNPLYIADIGFQLSFLSVFSLLLVAPMIEAWMGLDADCTTASHPIRQSIAAILAAQLLLMPLCAYYFHIVPLWFLPANLIIIPLLAPLLSLSVVAIALARLLPVVVAAVPLELLSRAVNLLAELVIRIGTFTADLPGLRPFYPSWVELLLLYLFAGLLLVAADRHSRRAFAAALALLALLVAWPYVVPSGDAPRELICFNHHRSNALHLVSGRSHIIYQPDSVAPPSSLYRQMAARRRLAAPLVLRAEEFEWHGHVGEDRSRDGVASTIGEGVGEEVIDSLKAIGINIRPPFVEVGGTRLCLLTTDSLRRLAPDKPVPVSYLILGGSARTSLAEARRLASPDTLVLLASLPRYRCKRLKAEADSIGLPTLDLSLHGALRVPLD